MLLELGKIYGYETSAAINDAKKKFMSIPLEEVATIKEFQRDVFHPKVVEIVSHIDVLWFGGDTDMLVPEFAFEVERTTIYPRNRILVWVVKGILGIIDVGKLLSQSIRIMTMKDALEYFRANLAEMISKYEGEYVAIIEDKIIDHGKDVKKVYQEAKAKFPKNIVFLGQVPRKEALIL